ncbi:hypothetical protein BKP35_17660 [Anaerobacillus arseniciselenatis]|uniref:Peptidase S8/S53 domain-containing protein n=1 Tax=Anaerobacillus arseniciselenatis TaxID=85682 RepID=A0A1S2L8T7_9BACI|nr:S8 family peptidase [Anaerobacillus arseniciselenatis]OIJ08403.1 hypothetical protein BKP35_17660 [Anaerobacillus arseniciselenatis]
MKRIMTLFLVFTLIVGYSSFPTSGTLAEESTEKYLVMFDGPAEKGILTAFGVEEENILHEYELLPVKYLELTERQAKGLSNHPQIKYVEEEAIAEAFGQTVPWGVPHVQGTTAHNEGYIGQGINVAILDTGIDNTHEDLSENVKGGYSVFTDVDNNDPFYDGSGHGTHVAGTVGAIDNELGVLGVAPQVNLYAVKVLNNDGSGSYAGIAQGIEWSIQNGMDIINMSLGGSSSSSILEEFSNLAYEEGLLVVAAAGNSGNPGGRGDNVSYPAKYESVIAVAAIDQNNKRGSFSSTGPAVELSAPGVGVLSTVPGNEYDAYNGTSMAAPHVAGVAALVWGGNSNLTNVEIRSLMQNTAQYLGSTNEFGYGLVKAKKIVNYNLIENEIIEPDENQIQDHNYAAWFKENFSNFQNKNVETNIYGISEERIETIVDGVYSYVLNEDEIKYFIEKTGREYDLYTDLEVENKQLNNVSEEYKLINIEYEVDDNGNIVEYHYFQPLNDSPKSSNIPGEGALRLHIHHTDLFNGGDFDWATGRKDDLQDYFYSKALSVGPGYIASKHPVLGLLIAAFSDVVEDSKGARNDTWEVFRDTYKEGQVFTNGEWKTYFTTNQYEVYWEQRSRIYSASVNDIINTVWDYYTPQNGYKPIEWIHSTNFNNDQYILNTARNRYINNWNPRVDFGFIGNNSTIWNAK